MEVNFKDDTLQKTKVFFDSIESQLLYRERNYDKFRNLNFAAGLTLFIFVLTVIPITPYLTGQLKIIDTTNLQLFGYEIPLKNFFFRWIGQVILFGLIYWITKRIDKYYERKELSYSLEERHSKFAFLYKCVKELEVFLVNDRKEHTENALKYLKDYFTLSFLKLSLPIRTENGPPVVDLPSVLTEIKKKRSWVTYSDSTEEVISAFNQRKEKIFERIRQKTEIDIVVDILNDLLIYEYILLDKVKSEKKGESFPYQPSDFIVTASKKINSIEILEELKIDKTSQGTFDKLTRVTNNFTNLFSHQNLIVTFISWFFLLCLIFIAAMYIGITVYKIKIDSTLYIGVISGIIVGAITISATVYSKKK